jgi:hypothetical protein
MLLIAADFSTLYEVRVLTVTKLSVAGHTQHSYALALVGAAVLGMTAAAGAGSRPGMLAVGLLGLLGLVVAGIAGDFGDVQSTGVIGRLYEDASAAPGPGFYFETLGGVLAILSGLGQLLLPRPAPARSRGEGGPPGAGEPRRPAAGGHRRGPDAKTRTPESGDRRGPDAEPAGRIGPDAPAPRPAGRPARPAGSGTPAPRPVPPPARPAEPGPPAGPADPEPPAGPAEPDPPGEDAAWF